MTVLRNFSWPRILTEGTIIVVSILLAFGIQAWWEERQDRENQNKYLASLRSALVDHQSSFAGSMDYARLLRESATRLLEISVNPENSFAETELDRLLAALTWHLPDPLTPELAALLSNEDLALIANSELAYQLGVLHAKLGRYERMVSLHQDFFFDELMPYLQEKAFLPQINNFVSYFPGTEDEVYPINKIDFPVTVSHSELLGSREFQNILMRRIWRLTDVVDWSDNAGGGMGINSEIDEILLFIDQELAL